jgi:hypothetical protein
MMPRKKIDNYQTELNILLQKELDKKKLKAKKARVSRYEKDLNILLQKEIDKKNLKAKKARARKKSEKKIRIRDSNGRFASKALAAQATKVFIASKTSVDVSKVSATNESKLLKILNDAGFSKNDVANFYNKEKKIFNEILNKGGTTSLNRNSMQIDADIRGYNGNIFLNGKKTTKAKAINALVSLKQFLVTNSNTVDFLVKPFYTFDGNMRLKIPTTNELKKKVAKNNGFKNFLDFLNSTNDEDRVDFFEIEFEDYEVILISSKK